MRFHFALYNHGPHSRETLKDTYLPVMHSLHGLGHDCSVSNQFDSSALNLVVEHFPDGWEKPLLESGVAYGLIVTEIYDGVGFNYEKRYQPRFDGCVAVARGAKFVWSMGKGREFWGQITKAASFDMGWCPKMEWDYVAAKPYDLILTASPSPEREKLVADLRAASFKVHWEQCGHGERNQAANVSKWGIGVLPSAKTKTVSATRILALVQAGCPVIIEHPEAVTQTYLTAKHPEAHWRVSWMLTLRSMSYGPHVPRSVWEAQRAALMTYCPMQDTVQRLLDETLLLSK